MKTYVITDKAGRFVAGQRNPGVGTTLRLTEKAAEAGLREGALVVRKDEADATSAEAPQKQDASKQPASKTQTKKAD
ncbi:hypothetical protein [Paracoccus sp. 22332]|uniref:hypothetical protein n=1 Tax=Paracoccus sp. 22332 TaxID=3453913 RepID=UPI003F8784F5